MGVCVFLRHIIKSFYVIMNQPVTICHDVEYLSFPIKIRFHIPFQWLLIDFNALRGEIDQFNITSKISSLLTVNSNRTKKKLQGFMVNLKTS